MWIVTLPNGVELDVSGGLRVLEIENGFYVGGFRRNQEDKTERMLKATTYYRVSSSKE